MDVQIIVAMTANAFKDDVGKAHGKSDGAKLPAYQGEVKITGGLYFFQIFI
jgi:hypothetical protein